MLFKNSLPWMQHPSTLASMTALSCGTLKSIILHSHTSLNSEHLQVYNQTKKSQQYSHCSVFTPQTPALLFSGSLCIQAFHRSTRVLIMTWADFFFTQLSCTYYNNPEYSKEALSALLLGELKCGKRFDLQK